MKNTLSRLSTLFALFATSTMLFAQSGGIKGTIEADDGSVLSFATIFVKQSGTGTTANEDGYYEIPLAPGRYDLVFQHLGRRSEVRVVEVKDVFIKLNIRLLQQDIVLDPVTINAGDEDPAYGIMRKAIAKANYHRNYLNSYSARVYIKGAGKLVDYPWLAKRQLEKEGIEKDRVYISESVSDITFTRPDKFEEKVISIRSDGNDNNTSPNPYIFGSFYEPEVAETISPLSPKAFSYYRFHYDGTFRDRDYEVSRIRVVPRSKGDNVVEGLIFIVEGDWSIHSLDIQTTKLGIDIHIRVMCAPIEEKAWLPVSHRFRVEGKVFGFEFEYNYLATVSNYRIEMNPELYAESMEVIDEKEDGELARRVEKRQRELNKGKEETGTGDLKERLASGEEITRKELKTIVKEYEKEERRLAKQPEVISETIYKIDSGAFRKDSTYWATIRPIPLTKEEIRGYEKSDSAAAAEKAQQAGDTVKQSRHQGFQPWDVLIGDSYRLGKHSNFRIYTPTGGFNTVEGLNLVYKLGVGTVLQDTLRTRMSLTPFLRYSFTREKFSGYASFRIRNRRHRLEVEGGRYIRQYNGDDPILPIINTFTTLFLENNLMKIYARDFAEVRYRRVLNPFITVSAMWSWSDRMSLTNQTDFKLVNRVSVEGYTPNEPVNNEVPVTGFENHQALTGSFSITARPWQKYRIRNGFKYPLRGSSPSLILTYVKGFDKWLGSDIRFDLVEAGVRHELRAGARGTVDFDLRAGIFLNAQKMYFPDFKHFQGNRTPFITNDPVGSFRLLDYYAYSTARRYVVTNVHYRFRKFLLTTIPHVRLAGIRENIFVSHLATPTSKNYMEAGYSIDGILRFFRLEGAVAFREGKYLGYGFRIGVSTALTINFSD